MYMRQSLSTTPYKGTTDTYPQDMLVRNYIFDVWTKTAKRFGYEEYDTPLLEDTELYRVKSGEELANTQLYNFTDKGGREVAIRPEMTPSLARMIAAKKNELTYPLRWFSLGKYYRYEKPQKGRRREFFQLNIDLLGIATQEAELEILQYILAVMDEFKAPKDTYEIRLSSRYLLDYLFTDILKVDNGKKSLLGRAIDNYPKMRRDEFVEYLKELELNDDQAKKLLDFLTWDLSNLKKIRTKSQGAQQLLDLFDQIAKLGLTNVRFEPSIVRGLAYYTGTVMEMFDIGSKENPRALLGGGRYDDLLSIFGMEKLPAFGFAWGNIIMEDYLRTYKLLPLNTTDTKVFVSLLDENCYTATQSIANTLRVNRINTEVQLVTNKLKNQLRYCAKKGIPWVIIVGEDELAAKKLQLKNMQSGEQSLVTLEEAINTIVSTL